MSTKKSTRRGRKATATTIPDAVSLPSTKKEQEAHIRAVARTCRGPTTPAYRKRIQAALGEGKLEEARRLDAEGRQGCGFDLNDLIVKSAFDGKERTVSCPKCGQEITYRAPAFGDLAE